MLRKDSTLRERAHHAINEAERYGKGLAYVPYAKASIALQEHKDLDITVTK